MSDQLLDPGATRTGQADGPAVQERPSRRRLFEIAAGALALALFGRTSTAASAAAGEPAPELSPEDLEELFWPGPGWERVRPSKPGGVRGWQNKKTGEFRTDWFPRSRGATGLDASELSLDPQVLLHGGWDAKARLWGD